MPVTFSACNPLGPFFTSNSTAWPSFNDLYPSIVIAEKCTKTSSPVWRWIKPKPFDALNHFTVPCSFTLQPRIELLCRLDPFPKESPRIGREAVNNSIPQVPSLPVARKKSEQRELSRTALFVGKR